MDLQAALRIGARLAEIMAGLHGHGVIHQDLNPAAVLVDPDTFSPTLFDLHIASRAGSESRQPPNPGMLGGSLAYMSPEQTGRISAALDTRADLYSLGVTLYEMLTRGAVLRAAF